MFSNVTRPQPPGVSSSRRRKSESSEVMRNGDTDSTNNSFATRRSGGKECQETCGFEKSVPTPHSTSHAKPASTPTLRASMLSNPRKATEWAPNGFFQPHVIRVLSFVTFQPHRLHITARNSTFGLSTQDSE